MNYRKHTTPYQAYQTPNTESFSFIHEGRIVSEGMCTAENPDSCDLSCNLTDPTCAQNWTNLGSNYYTTFGNMNDSLNGISRRVGLYNTGNQYLLENPVYAYDGNVLGPPPSVQDGTLEDLHQIAIQENTLYIIGSITVATLFIGAIMLGSRN